MVVYIVNRERFEKIDCMGYSPLAILKKKFPDAVLVQSAKDIKAPKGEIVAVLHADTPLVDMDFLTELADTGASYAIGDGYIKTPSGRTKRVVKDDVRATQITGYAEATAVLKELKKQSLKRFSGRDILFYDIDSCYIDFDVEISDGAIIYPMVALRGKTKIGKNSIVYSYCDLTDTVIGKNVDIRSTYSTGAVIGDGTTVGPFATLRAGSVVGAKCRVGNYVEIKNSKIGDETKAAHLAYIGDATVGKDTNVGCGTVFANYNGRIKQKTVVGDNVFIGANTNLIAPLVVEDGVYIAAGSTVTHDIPSGALCIARSRQVVKHDYARK